MKQADFLRIQSLNSGKVKRRKQTKGTFNPVVPIVKTLSTQTQTILYAAQSSLQAAKDRGLKEKRPKIDFNEICHMPTTTAPISTGVECKRQEKLPNSASQVKHKDKLPTNDIPVTSISGSRA